MSRYIIMTSYQASQISGPSRSTPGAMLFPLECKNGIFILNAQVLTDPDFESKREYLSFPPQMDDTDPNFPLPLDPPTT